MELKLLDKNIVVAIHDSALNSNELAGFAGDKSLDAVLGRVENRLHYGLIGDEFDLAASYACVLAVGHVFNDANKRTAFAVLDTCLLSHGIELQYNVIELADLIIQAAQSRIDEQELAQWLRRQVS